MRQLKLILLLFILLGSIYAVTTPIFEASDELWHYPFVRHLAAGNPLPVQDPNRIGPWRQEASQQPLYYALAAGLTFWIDTSDMESVRWLNPHVDTGVLTQDGNTNLVVHRPERESFPWRGTVLAVRLIRLFSVLMGAGTVYFTWRIALTVFPERPELALGAAAVNAFTPMFLFISGAVNNDNLAMLLSSTALFLLIRNSQLSQTGPARSAEQAAGILRSGTPGRVPPTTGSNLKDWLLLGVVLGLAALTKTSALGLIPLAILALLIAVGHHFRERDWRRGFTLLLRHGLAIVLPVLLIAGWWYYRNFRLYGDWLGWNVFIQVLGRRAHPASLRQLWGERWGFSLSYWGLFGGVNVPMPQWVYHVLNAVGVVAAAGLMVCLARAFAATCQRVTSKAERRTTAEPFQQSPGAQHKPRVRFWMPRLWPLSLLLLWTVAIFAGLVRWATVTWSSQGRLVFPAISATSTLLVAGLFSSLPSRVGRPAAAQPSRWGVALLSGWMFVISAAAPFAWIAPAYRPPAAPTGPAQHPLDTTLGGRMRLLGYSLAADSVEPGGQLDLSLHWETLAPMTRDWSVFVHLNDPAIAAPVAQRDMYLGQGLLATRLLEPGTHLANRYVVPVPGTTYAPTQADLVVGMYDTVSGERLPAADGRDAIVLAQVAVNPASQGPYPNPVHYDFSHQLALIGYRLEPRRLRPGDTLTLELFWQALTEMDIDYTIFTHLRDLEDPSNRIYAQHDAPPPGGTSTWREGQVVEAVYQLTLAEDTPAAVLEVECGVYHRDAEGRYQRLQLVTPDGRLVDDFLVLGKVRVD